MYLHPTAGWLASWRSCSAGKIWLLVTGRWLLEAVIQPIPSLPILLFLRFQVSASCQTLHLFNWFNSFHWFGLSQPIQPIRPIKPIEQVLEP